MLGIGGNAISVVISILVALLVFGVLIFVHELRTFYRRALLRRLHP